MECRAGRFAKVRETSDVFSEVPQRSRGSLVECLIGGILIRFKTTSIWGRKHPAVPWDSDYVPKFSPAKVFHSVYFRLSLLPDMSARTQELVQAYESR